MDLFEDFSVSKLPPCPPLLQVIRIDSLAAALAKLNANISIDDLLKAIHEEDEAKRVKAAAVAESTPEATQRRRAALRKP
ncbi:hypothetical protein DXG03_005629 [Asterophora parasitica]|uniref:Uncharacterized protein n=1 Tax=Asterophora parasitica TaxID=117018 RepID=A0A9P7G8U8_9AGAR|nr:hypothetical protein DXG03_005629 [Asterophora parasitica]